MKQSFRKSNGPIFGKKNDDIISENKRTNFGSQNIPQIKGTNFRNETVILEFKRTNFGNKKNPFRNQTDKKESKRVIILVVLLEQRT